MKSYTTSFLRCLQVAFGWALIFYAVQPLAAQGPSPFTNGLVGYFPFNGNTRDGSGMGRHAAIYDPNTARLANDRFGRPESAIQFLARIGDWDPVVFGTGMELAGKSMTITYWASGVYRTEDGDWSGVFLGDVPPGTPNPGGSQGRNLQFYTNFRGFRFAFFFEELDYPSPLQTNTWSHVAATYDKVTGHRTISINGVVVAENQATFGYSGNSNFLMGGRNGSYIDDCRFYDRALSPEEIRDLFVYESRPPGPRGATAVAQLVDGSVVGATITDGGFGYTNSPPLVISGGGGSGATGITTISNGVVVGIQILSSGSGYLQVPDIAIALPPIPPRRAVALAGLTDGAVSSLTLQDEGFGYTAGPPAVRISGGGGTGATATPTTTNGVVTGFVITNPGTGYTSAPRVRIASPPFSPELSMQVSRVSLTLKVVLGSRYQIESSDELGQWLAVGAPFVAEDELLVQEFEANSVSQYFRIRQVP
jgi:hypothetical protein